MTKKIHNQNALEDFILDLSYSNLYKNVGNRDLKKSISFTISEGHLTDYKNLVNRLSGLTGLRLNYSNVLDNTFIELNKKLRKDIKTVEKRLKEHLPERLIMDRQKTIEELRKEIDDLKKNQIEIDNKNPENQVKNEPEQMAEKSNNEDQLELQFGELEQEFESDFSNENQNDEQDFDPKNTLPFQNH